MTEEMIAIDGGAIVSRLDQGMLLVVDPAQYRAGLGGDGPWAEGETMPISALAQAPPARDGGGGVLWRIDLGLGETSIRLRSRIAAETIGLLPRIAHLRRRMDGQPNHCLDITGTPGCYCLWCDDTMLTTTATTQDLIGEVYGTLLELAVAPRRLALLIHAAALVVEGTGLLLSARSGGGKTTMTLGLAKAGATILTDDAVGLMEDDLALAGLPVALRIRPGGWPLAARLLPSSAAEIPADSSGIRHIPPNWAGDTRQFSPAAAVILLDYQPDAPSRWQRVSAAQGLATLIQAGASLPLKPSFSVASALGRWCGQTRFFGLTFGSLENGVRDVLAIRSTLA